MRCVRLVILALWCATPVWAAPATQPATQPAPAGVYDHRPLRPRSAERADGQAARGARASEGSSFDYGRWGLSLVVVIGLIFVTRYLGRRLMGLETPGAGGAITVLARQVLSPKQQLMLVQVGRRVVLVSNGGGQMNTLAEITEPDEIAEIVTQANRRRTVAANSFRSLFGMASAAYGPPAEEAATRDGEAPGNPPPAADPQLSQTRAELRGLLEKVRLISGAVKKS